jgi:hypothetical protein
VNAADENDYLAELERQKKFFADRDAAKAAAEEAKAQQENDK